MLKKIIDQTKKASFTLVNISLGLFTIIAVLIIASYQVFVDSSHRPIALNKFFNIKFLKRISDLHNKNSLCFDNINMIVYQKGNIIFLNNNKEVEQTIALEKNETRESRFFINKAKNKIAFLTQNNSQHFINIFSLTNSQLNRISLEDNVTNIDIINFDSLDNVYLAYQKQKEWLVVRIEGKEIVSIINGISYDGEELTQSAEPIKNLIIYPECFSRRCHFILYHIKEGSKEEIVIANEENNLDIAEVVLYYFDEDNGKIIYQIPNKKTAYISDFSAYLWHHILLEPASDNLLTIRGILRDNREVKKLIVFSKTKKQAYIYDINYIGLDVIDLPEGYEVIGNQISLPSSCLLLQNNEGKKFLIQDIGSQKTKPIVQEAEDVQLF